MDINNSFPSNYQKAADLKGQARQVVIADVAPEDMGSGETKPVARFNGLDRGLVLNKTNSMMVASHFGSETNTWIGKTIELYPDKVPFQGQIVDAIRVRVPVPPAQPAATPAQPVAPPADDLNDAIPNWD